MNEVSLFSFEVAVSTVFLRRAVTCRVPLVAFRLLDYPTIGVSLLSDEEIEKIRGYAKENPNAAASTQQITQLQHSTGTYAFKQGKSCLLKRPLSELQEHLSCTPLYVMLMDVLLDTPKLVASCSVNLDGVVRRIVKDVSLNGIDIPSSQGIRDVFPLYNLMGDKVGEIDFGVRLLSLGVAMLQHVSGVSEPGMRSEIDDEILKKPSASPKKSALKTPPEKERVTRKSRSARKDLETDENKENRSFDPETFTEDGKSATTQTKTYDLPSKGIQVPFQERPKKSASTENVFCPPALYLDKAADDAERKPQRNHIVSKGNKVHYGTQSEDHFQGNEKIIIPSSVTYRSPPRHVTSHVTSHATQTETAVQQPLAQSALKEFPLLKALVEEVAKLGLGTAAQQPAETSAVEGAPQKLTKAERPYSGTTPGRRSAKKQPGPKQPLRFGLTNSTRLRIAMNKSIRMQEEVTPRPATPKRTPKLARPLSLGQTFIKSHSGRTKKSTRMVTRAIGPDVSMYRQDHGPGYPRGIQQQTVYLGRMAGYEEATDLDITSLGHQTSDSRQERPVEAAEEKGTGFGFDDLVIVKDRGTPRADSRQSQRSIEIHLPTASTEFSLGREDDEGEWESTFSDREKLEERMKREIMEERRRKENQSSETFYTPPESVDTSRADSEHKSTKPEEVKGGRKDVPVKLKASENDLKNISSDISTSDRYKYSDDFEDDKTWSANRTPSAMTPVNSSLAIKEEDETERDVQKDAVFPSTSFESTLTTTKSSDFTTESEGDRPLDELRSASAQKIASSDDGFDSSSLSRGTSSVVTTLMTASKSKLKKSASSGKMKVGGISVPEPVPSDSPVVQSINTESSSIEQFPDPQAKHGLVARASKHKKKLKSKDIHLPESVDERPASSQSRRAKFDVHPKPSRMTPSPPHTRKFSPVSSPESSRERMKKRYQHPGRRTRPSSSGSGTISSDPEKPQSPVRRSDSVSSYQPSDISEISNVKLSEELDNLSDILSEEQDSQGSRSMLSSKGGMPSDGPKTYFGKPSLDPSSKLGYTT